MSPDGFRIVFLGAGSHARVLKELHEEQGGTVSGYLAPESGAAFEGVDWLGSDDILGTLDPSQVRLVNGIGSVRVPVLRRDIYLAAQELGFGFLSLVDGAASIRRSATLRDGVQILPGAVIGSGATIEENVLLNSGVIVEHDSVVGRHSHLSPGVSIAGDVSIGECVHIGIGATVIQGVHVGAGSTIGAGAVVLADVPPGSVAVGVPAVARPYRSEDDDG